MAAQKRRSCSIGTDHGFQDPCTDHTPVVEGWVRGGRPPRHRPSAGLDAGPIYGTSVVGIRTRPSASRRKYLDYRVTADPASCGNGRDGFWIWGACPPPVTIGCEDANGGDARWGASKGDRERVYAIDVDSTIYTFFTAQPGRMAAADRAEFQRFLDSITFESSTN
jgi:hypothetical protein